MYEFKKGAFSVAAKAKVPVVPVTLVGTGLGGGRVGRQGAQRHRRRRAGAGGWGCERWLPPCWWHPEGRGAGDAPRGAMPGSTGGHW